MLIDDKLRKFQDGKNIVVIALLDCCRSEIALSSDTEENMDQIDGQRHITYACDMLKKTHSSCTSSAATDIWLK